MIRSVGSRTKINLNRRSFATGDRRIIGVMLESNLVVGAQKLLNGRPLVYGQCITDACTEPTGPWSLTQGPVGSACSTLAPHSTPAPRPRPGTRTPFPNV